MRRRAASKKPEEAAARPAQPSEGSALPLPLGPQNAALRAENADLRHVIAELRAAIAKLLPLTRGWDQNMEQAYVKALRTSRPDEPLPEQILAALVLAAQSGRGRKRTFNGIRLLVQVDRRRPELEARKGQLTDREVLREIRVEELVRDQRITEERARTKLKIPGEDKRRFKADLLALGRARKATSARP